MIFLLICIFLAATAEPIYENSTNICQRCTCTKSDDAQTLTLDCASQKFSNMLANWPEHNATIKAIFTGSNFTSLERLPETDADVEIVLSRCNIQYLYPAVFETCVNVKFVDFSHNFLNFEKLSSDKFRGPYSGYQAAAIGIEDLNLAYNQIHSLHNDLFKFLPNLTRLNLEGNDFKVLDVQTQLALGTVPRLLSLNLADNELTELVPSAIENLQGLVQIDLSKNRLDFVPHSLKVVGKSLEVLIVDNNPIIELAEDSFAGLNNIRQISANNLTKLRWIDVGTFATLGVTKLSLCNNTKLTDIKMGAFNRNSSVKELYLANNNLSTLPYTLLDWSQLDTLDISDNPLSCTCNLYNITASLSRDVTRTANGPTCLDPTTKRPLQVYSLKSDICSVKRRRSHFISYHHFSVPLALLLVTMMMALLVASSLGYNRYRRLMRKDDHHSARFIYSPLFSSPNV